MVTDLFHPFKDDLLQHFLDDFRSFLRSCDGHYFEDVNLFCEDSQPHSSSILDKHQDVVIP
jgi:hypothetical protein